MLFDESRYVQRCTLFLLAVALPNRRFWNAGANVHYQQRRQRTSYKQSAPTEERKYNPVNERGEQNTNGIALLQNSGEQTTCRRRQRFHCQGSAESPFAAHANSEECAQNQKDGKIRSKRRKQFNNRIKNDVRHQRDAPAEFVAEQTEDKRTQRAHHQCQRNSECDFRNRSPKIVPDRHQHEREQKKIEGIQRPAEEASNECIALISVE